MKALLSLLAKFLRLVDALAWRVREADLRRRFAQVGRGLIFDPVSSRFVTPQLIRFGDDCFLNAFAHLSGDIHFGDRVLVGPGVKILSGNHMYGVEGMEPRYLKASAENPELLETIVIESDAWIGANAVIVGGATVGSGAVVAAGAVVTASVPPYTVCAGVPARVIRRIFDDAALERHLIAIGLTPDSVRDLLDRRRQTVDPAVTVATPPLPARFLYRGDWVEAVPLRPLLPEGGLTGE